MPEPLTKRQQQVLDIVRDHIREEGVPASIHEIRDALHVSSVGAVTDHLLALERKGYLQRGAKGSARSWRLVQQDTELEADASFLSVPVMGAIAAGVPITVEGHVEERMAVPPALVGAATECFILRVKGDSMTGDSICDGDFAILKAQQDAKMGDIVAVYLDGEATLKHYVKLGRRVELHSSNPDYAPIPVDMEQSHILGKLVGLMRPYS